MSDREPVVVVKAAQDRAGDRWDEDPDGSDEASLEAHLTSRAGARAPP